MSEDPCLRRDKVWFNANVSCWSRQAISTDGDSYQLIIRWKMCRTENRALLAWGKVKTFSRSVAWWPEVATWLDCHLWEGAGDVRRMSPGEGRGLWTKVPELCCLVYTISTFCVCVFPRTNCTHLLSYLPRPQIRHFVVLFFVHLFIFPCFFLLFLVVGIYLLEFKTVVEYTV